MGASAGKGSGEFAARLANLSSAILADALVRLKLPLHVLPASIRPLEPSMGARGPARTVRHFGSVDVFLEALEVASPGEVLIIDNGDRDDEACIGDLAVIEAEAAGIAGVIVWGRLRDSAELRRIGLPVFSTGFHALGPTTLRRRTSDAFGPLRIGPETVSNGDVIVADEDAVLVLDPARLDEVLDVGEGIARTERRQARRVLAGESLRTQLRFGDYLRARDADPTITFREHLRRIGGAIEE